MRRNALKLLAVSFAVASGIAHAGSTVSLSAGNSATPSSYHVFYDPNGSSAAVKIGVPAGGSVHLAFSNGTGVVDGAPVFSVGGVVAMMDYGSGGLAKTIGTVSSTSDTSTVAEQWGWIGSRNKTYARTNVAVDSKLGSIRFDINSALISDLMPTGGFLISFPKALGWTEGGALKVTNVKVDFLTQTVYADLASEAFGSTPRSKIRYQVPLWTFDQYDGTLQLPIKGLATGDVESIKQLGYQIVPNTSGGYDLSNTIQVPTLKITNAGLAALTLALGTPPGSTSYSNFENINLTRNGWGSLVINNKLSSVQQ